MKRWVLFLIIFQASAAYSTVIHIPADQPTIQAGLGSAADKDTLLLAPGTYEGAANHGFAVTNARVAIISEAGPASTIVNLEGDFFMHPVDPYDSRMPLSIEGLTFRGGSDVIIYSVTGPGRVHDCIFDQNLTGLTANVMWTGGEIDSCVFKGNATGILLADEAYQNVTGNLFIHNMIGLDLKSALNTVVAGNIVAFNDIGVKDESGLFHFTDNVVYGNFVGFFGFFPQLGKSFLYNDVFGNATNYESGPDLTGAEGNISAHPMFCDSTLATSTTVRLESPLLWSIIVRGITMGNVSVGCSCCQGIVGDANGSGDDKPTIGDISAMISARFIISACENVIPCIFEADINRSGGDNPMCDDITIGDISMLIDYLFITGQGNMTLPGCLY